jgi:hypothetical protein
MGSSLLLGGGQAKSSHFPVHRVLALTEVVLVFCFFLLQLEYKLVLSAQYGTLFNGFLERYLIL